MRTQCAKHAHSSRAKCADYAQDLEITFVQEAHMGKIQVDWFKARKKELRVTDANIAARIRRDRSIVNKMLNGDLDLDLSHVAAFAEALKVSQEELLYRFGVLDTPPSGGSAGEEYRREPDLPEVDPQKEYVPVEVLPTYGGMGGGGTGDADREIALIPRALVVDILRGKPGDFLLINVRGDSMEPDFQHGDQILVDRRDMSPSQPGPFALWDGEWGEYVVKNVERLPGGEVRIFSTNPKYTTISAPVEETRIIGRPVWFGRRL